MGRNPHKGIFDRDTATDRDIIRDALARVGLAGFSQRNFNTLSGGGKQRVMIARILTQQASFLVLDEPTNHLDIRYQLETMELVRGLGLTTLAALHDLNIAATYCDFIHVIDKGQIVSSGRTEKVLLPRLIEDDRTTCSRPGGPLRCPTGAPLPGGRRSGHRSSSGLHRHSTTDCPLVAVGYLFRYHSKNPLNKSLVMRHS